jgi:succinoglycan biosynthesis protein ExoA
MLKNPPFISVIIPVSTDEKVIKKCLESVFTQSYPASRFEVILVGSFDNGASFCQSYPLEIINADVSPGAKRNMAAEKAKGTILALCDDDVVVDRDWLRNLASSFNDPMVAVVGGPNLNRPDASFKERCSGYIFSSFLGSASMSTRYRLTSSLVREAEESDLISCNMAVRKSVMEKFGFPENIWPNEENIFCYNVKKNGYKLLYDPKAIVCHRRRSIFLPHIKQVFGYGRGRGQMMRMYPSSIKILNIFPSLFIVSLSAGALLSMLNGFVFTIYSVALLTYFAIVILTSAKIAVQERDLKAFFMLPLAFLLHHCAYGLGVLKGLMLGGKGKANK